MAQQYVITIDPVRYDDGHIEWEARAEMPDGELFGWASTDAHTLMAAIGRDLAKEEGQ